MFGDRNSDLDRILTSGECSGVVLFEMLGDITEDRLGELRTLTPKEMTFSIGNFPI